MNLISPKIFRIFVEKLQGPSQSPSNRRLSVVGSDIGGRRSSLRCGRRRSSIYLNPGEVNQDVKPEKSILRRESVMDQTLIISKDGTSNGISNTTSLFTSLNPNLPGLNPNLPGLNPNLPGLGGPVDRRRSIMKVPSNFMEEDPDFDSPVQVN